MHKILAGVVGIEPTLSESKSDMLPLHNTPTKKQDAYFSIKSWIFKFAERILKLVRGKGIEPLTTGWKPVILPLNEPRIKLVCVAGFEPAASSFQTRPSTGLTLYTDKNLVSVLGFEPRPYRPKRQVQPDNTLQR